MNKVVSLVNEWDKFEQQQAQGEIADFCRYYLAQQAVKREHMVGGHVPPNDTSLLMKILGRLLTASRIYFEAAMSELGLAFPEMFYFLNQLHYLKEVKKTELINTMLMEYTTGIDAINKMIKAGLIDEREHDTDKRAKLVRLSEKGEALLLKCYPQMKMVTEMVFKSMHPEAIKLCISLLAEVEMHQSNIVHEAKGKPFKEMYEYVMRQD